MNRTKTTLLLFALSLFTTFNLFSYNKNLPAADLNLIKTVDTPFPAIGEEVTFAVKVENEGPLDATGIVIHAYVKNGYSNINSISNGGTVTGDTIIWNINSLLDGASISLNYSVTVKEPGDDVDYDNTAEVFALDQYDRDSDPGNGPDPDGDGLIGPLDTNPNDGSIDPDGEDDSDNEPVHPIAIDLSLIKTVDEYAPYIGDTINYSIEVHNDGPNDATGVVITDYLPLGLTNIHNITGSGVHNGNNIIWDDISIDVGESAFFDFSAEVGTTDDYVNIAEITEANEYDVDSSPGNGADTDSDGLIGPLDDDGSQDDDDEDDGDDAEINPKRIDLNLIKTASNTSVNIGEFVTIYIELNNESNFNATGIQVTDFLPGAYGTIQNISNSGQLNGSEIVWNDHEIDANSSLTLSFDAEIIGANLADCINIAEITAADQNDIDSHPGNGADTDGDGLIGPLDDDGSQDEDDEDDGDDAKVIPCSLQAEIVGADDLCFGDCTDLSANAANGFGSLTYEWSNGLDPLPNVNVCPNETTTYSVTITDEMGCQDIANHTITVKCIEAPELTLVGAEDHYDCSDEPNFGNLEIDSDCSIISESIVDTVLNDSCPAIIQRTWTVVNECNKSYTIKHIATAVDIQGPVLINVPDDITISCLSDIPDYNDIAAEDNCDPDPIVDLIHNSIPDCSNGSFLNTWVATDCEGNTSSYSQTITLNDLHAPQFDTIPEDLIVSCESVPLALVISATDNCDDEVEVIFSETLSQDTCPQTYTLIRVWIAADCSENADTITQLIHVQDITAPIFSGIGPDSTYQCGETLNFSHPTVSDNCSEVSLEFYDRTTTMDCGRIITRKWTATDECGNSSSASQILTELDTISPVFSIIEDEDYDCSLDPVFADPQVADNCSEVTLSYVDIDGQTSCAGTSSIRIWTAVDECGNESTTQQVLTPVDTVPPMFEEILLDGTYPCGTDPVFDNATATDDCSGVSISYEDETLTASCSGSGIRRTWTAIDACGNTSKVSQTMLVEDNDPPIITDVGPDDTFECNTTPVFSEPTASDACTTASLEFEDTIDSTNCTGLTITRFWTATDECGNTSTASQILTGIDTISPGFAPLSDTLNYNCGSIPFPPDVVATDNCSEITITMSESFGTSDCAGAPITFSWTATDACGNTTAISQTQVPIDTIPPTISGVSPDGNYDCSENINFSDPTAHDNCSVVVLTYADQQVTGSCAGLGTLRIWTATDACGNESTASQTLTPIDTIAPEITEIGSDGFFSCSEPGQFDMPVALDDCSAVSINFEDTIGASSCAGDEIIRTWTITDACGNITSATHKMTPLDTIPPIIAGVGIDGTFDCSDSPVFSQPTAEDNCTAVTLEFSDETTVDNNCRVAITRTWTAIDGCGNASMASQSMISIDDAAPLIIGVEQDSSYQCGDAVEFSNPTVEDNCSEPTLSFNDVIDQLGCTTTTTRTWIATDECGNTSSASQTLSITDELAPVFSNTGMDDEYDCGTDPEFTEPIITDCSDYMVDVADELIEENCAGDVIKRSWTATDECGNVSTHTQTLTAIDTIKPTFEPIEEDVVFPCNEMPPFAEPVAHDNCGTVTITFVNFPGSRTCSPDGVMRIWTATDECGNTCTIKQTLTPIDTIPPVITGVGPGGQIECDDIPVFSEPTAEDACTSSVLSFEDEMIMGDCDHISITRKWTAEDACGNKSFAEETFYYSDTISPVIGSYEDILVFDCTESIAFPDLSANDRCGEVTIGFTDSPGDPNCFGNDIIRTWMVTDECGNVATAIQIATLIDTIAPSINPIPDTIYQDCALPLEFSDIVTSDNCTAVTLIYSEYSIMGTCTGSGTARVWTATDLCGNSSMISQAIIPIDTIAPNLSDVGLDGFYNCDELPVFPDPDVPDNCGQVTLSYVDTPSAGSCAGPGTTRAWTAIDECGNVSTASQTLDPIDIIAPTITGTEINGFVECGVGPIICGLYTLSKIEFDLNSCRSFEADFSHTDYSEFVGQVNNIIGGVQIGSGILYRNNPVENPHSCTPGINATQAMCIDSYDDCNYDPGNEKSLVIDIDIDPGSLGEAFIESLSFYEQAPEEFTFSHGPSGPNNYPLLYGIRILVDGVAVYTENNISTSREWSFDYYYLLGEGISVNAGSTIRIELLPYCTVGITAVMSAWDLEQIEVTFSDRAQQECVDAYDNCLDFTLEYSDSPGFDNCAGGNVVRTWIAFDECGNFSSASQNIFVNDSRPPVIIGIEGDGTFMCGSDPVFSVASAFDDCSEVTLNYSDQQLGKIITRTWTAVDECGNITTASQSLEEVNCLIDLELDKMVDDDEVSLGDEITFTIELYNNSEFTAHEVIVLDKLETGFYHTAHHTDYGIYNPITGLWYVGNLEGYETASLEITVWVNAGDDYINLASVVSVVEDDVDSYPNNRVDTNLDGDFSDDPNDEDDGDGVVVNVQDHYYFKVFPHPAKAISNLEIYSYKDAGVRWEIYNNAGQLVRHSDTKFQKEGTKSYQLDLKDLSSGSYMIRVYVDRHRVSKKLIIID